ncbi:unnamed protein product [Ambrosiozyma monospora]|uniref:Unnamed protein product n=1 Tax=Ambrosiozyma monospora TaxID=43982 RepID=A0A9W6Z4I4_AMBMO|nr:unnamed protein product [Ambrosiozyma monospora]
MHFIVVVKQFTVVYLGTKFNVNTGETLKEVVLNSREEEEEERGGHVNTGFPDVEFSSDEVSSLKPQVILKPLDFEYDLKKLETHFRNKSYGEIICEFSGPAYFITKDHQLV